MNKAALVSLIILIFAAQAVFAGVGTGTGWSMTPGPCDRSTPTIEWERYECGDCSQGYTNECRTLYKVTKWSDCRTERTPAQTKAWSDFQYCYNNTFRPLIKATKYDCRPNTQAGGRIDSTLVTYYKAPYWNWTVETTTVPKNCYNGTCNRATGQCDNTGVQFRATGSATTSTTDCRGTTSTYWKCEQRFDLGGALARSWFEVERQYGCNNIVQKNKCAYGCTNGRCAPAPVIEQKCRNSFLGCTEYKINELTNVEIRGSSRYYLGRTCNYGTGLCEKKQKTCEPEFEKRCESYKVGNKTQWKVVIEGTASNCQKYERVEQYCGSCQTCFEHGTSASCLGAAGGCSATVNIGINVSTSASTASNYSVVYRRDTSGASGTSGSTASNYGSGSSADYGLAYAAGGTARRTITAGITAGGSSGAGAYAGTGSYGSTATGECNKNSQCEYKHGLGSYCYTPKTGGSYCVPGNAR